MQPSYYILLVVRRCKPHHCKSASTIFVLEWSSMGEWMRETLCAHEVEALKLPRDLVPVITEVVSLRMNAELSNLLTN
jgi:hypothetical protein